LAGVKPLSPFTAERLLAHNVFVAGGTLSAGILGFVFQAFITHRLEPADYGAVFAVLTLLTFIGLPAAALTLLMARETSRDRATGRYAPSTALLRSGNAVLLIAGTILAIGLIVASPWISAFFHLPVALVVAAAAGLPLGLPLPLLLGELQGRQWFGSFALLTGGQAMLKLVAAIVLGALLGSVGLVIGISVATSIAYIVARWLLRRKFAIRARWAWWRPAVGYLSIVLPSTLAVAVLLSADILVVKHFFSARMAGEYAAVAALGRAIYWAAAGIAVVLFPKVIVRETGGKSGSELILASLLLVWLGGTVALTMLALAAGPLLGAFAGPAYAGGASYLAWYGLGMMLFGAASVLIATYQSRGTPRFLLVLVPVAVLEPVFITWLHDSLLQVVQLVDLCMALLLCALASMYLAEVRTRLRGLDLTLPIQAEPAVELAASLGVRAQGEFP
jgi:O-antigen/teichoic acid export membrane protein